MNLYPLSAYLSGKLSLEWANLGMYVYNFPETVTQGILLIESVQGGEIVPELPKYVSGTIHVIIRSPTFKTAKLISESCMKFLTIYEKDLGDIIIKQCFPKNVPTPRPRTSGDVVEFVIYLDVRYIEK